MSDLFESVGRRLLQREGEEIKTGGLPAWAEPIQLDFTKAQDPALAPWEQALPDRQIELIEKFGNKDEITASVRSAQALQYMGVHPSAINPVKAAIKQKFEITDDRGFFEKFKIDWQDAVDHKTEIDLWKVPLFGVKMTPEDREKWQKEVDIVNERIRERDRTRNILGEIGFAVTQQIPTYYAGAQKGWKIGAVLALMTFGTITLASGGTALAPAAYAGIKAGMAGVQAGITEEMMEVMAASMYKSFSTTPGYEDLPESWKRAASWSYGIAGGMVEMFQMRAIGKPVSQAMKMRFAKVASESIETTTKPTGLVSSWLTVSGEEIGEEGVQKILELGIMDMTARLWNEFGEDKGIKISKQAWGAMANEFLNEMLIAAPVAMLLSGVLSTAPSAVFQIGRQGVENKTSAYRAGQEAVMKQAHETAGEYLDRIEKEPIIIDTVGAPPTGDEVMRMAMDAEQTVRDPTDPFVSAEMAQPVEGEPMRMTDAMGPVTAEQLELRYDTAEEFMKEEEKIDFEEDLEKANRAIREILPTQQGLTEQDVSWMGRTKTWLGMEFLHPERFMDSIEGGRGFQGTIREIFFQQHEALDKKQFLLKEYMAEQLDTLYEGLKVNNRVLTDIRVRLDNMRILVDGRYHTLTYDELADLWASQFDADKESAVLHGIFESDHKAYEQALDQVPEGLRTLAERTIAWYKEWYPSLNAQHFKRFGIPLEEIAGYTPLWRDMYLSTGFDSDVLNDAKYRGVVRQTSDIQTFQEERIHHLDPETQQRLVPKLGLMATQGSMMQRMSHFLTKSDYLQKLDAIYKQIQIPLRQKVGSVRTAWLGEYINTLKHPETAYGVAGAESFLRRLRQNATLGILSMNLNIVMKQGPSVLMYTIEGGMNVAKNAMRVFLPNGLRDMTHFAMSNSNVLPQMQLDPVFHEIALGNYRRFGHAMHQVGMVGTWGIRAVDRLVKVIGWNSVYERYMSSFKDHDYAVEQADRVTRLTQPTARPQDMAGIYKEGEFSRTLMMFSKQLMNYTGTIFYDVPMYMRQKGMRGRAFGYMAAVSTAMVSVWMIANKRMPSTKDDLLDIALTFGALLPVMGKLITAVGRPFSGAEVPILDIPGEAFESLATKGWSKKAERKILDILGATTLTGFPYGFVKKAYRASKNALRGEWEDAFANMLGSKDWDTIAEGFYGADEKDKNRSEEVFRR